MLAACRADPAPTLVAVSKLMPVETLMLAYNENQRHLCTVPRTTMKGAEMVDEVNVHSVSGILLEFLSAQSPSGEEDTESIGRVNSRRTQCLFLSSKATPSGLRL